MSTTSPATRRAAHGTALITLNSFLFIGSGVFAIAAAWQAFWAYFSIEGPAPAPGTAALVAIDVCAGISVLAAAASVVVALVIRGRWGVVFGSLSALGLVGAVVLAVLVVSPQVMSRPSTGDGPGLPANYQPCYSGSGTCN